MKIAPSILSADFGALASAIAAVEPAVDWVHVDVMDGHFVPNITIGPPVVRSLRKHTSLPLDCHLMVSDPGAYVEAFCAAGADSLSVHIEAVPDPRAVLGRIAANGVGCGLALNPDTPFTAVEPYVELVDIVLVMTVQPGFGGQAFRDDVLPKIEKCADHLSSHGLTADIEVDGGISARTARAVVDAGARVLVAGSAIFDAADARGAAEELRRSVAVPDTPVGAYRGGDR